MVDISFSPNCVKVTLIEFEVKHKYVIMTDAGQCSGCNQWSDRSDEVKRIVSDTSHLSEKPYFACLNLACEVFMFRKGASGPTAGHRLNIDGIRDSNKSVREVKNEKLEHYDLE